MTIETLNEVKSIVVELKINILYLLEIFEQYDDEKMRSLMSEMNQKMKMVSEKYLEY